MPLNVLVEEPAVRVMAPGIVRADSQLIQNRSFRRWTGTVKSAGMLRLVLPGRQNGPPWLLAALVGGLAVALVGRRLVRHPFPSSLAARCLSR